jgi:hypothetical protein
LAGGREVRGVARAAACGCRAPAHLINGGLTKSEHSLGISERTVKTHLGYLFEKLGVTSRTEAVKIATRRGLVRLG